MFVLGYMMAVLMGLVLGLIGAGGSILTVPILVYLFGIKPVVATSYSLLIVGSAAAVGALHYIRHKQAVISAAVAFSLPSMLMVLATRRFIVPAIPDPLLGISKDVLVMILFAVLMIAAASFMLRPMRAGVVGEVTGTRSMSVWRIARLVLGSAGVGLLTGMVGAGGGFLIIPTLIALFGLGVKEAIGTSLLVIAINSLIGFRGDVAAGVVLDYSLLTTFLAMTVAGMMLGTTIGKRMDGGRLRTAFGIFTLLVGAVVFMQELWFVWRG